MEDGPTGWTGVTAAFLVVMEFRQGTGPVLTLSPNTVERIVKAIEHN